MTDQGVSRRGFLGAIMACAAAMAAGGGGRFGSTPQTMNEQQRKLVELLRDMRVVSVSGGSWIGNRRDVCIRYKKRKNNCELCLSAEAAAATAGAVPVAVTIESDDTPYLHLGDRPSAGSDITYDVVVDWSEWRAEA